MARNLGPAAARNLGIVSAQNDLILFTDDDCEPDPNWVRELHTAMRDCPEFAGVGGPVVSAAGSRFGPFFDHHRLLDPKLADLDKRPAYLVTANAAYTKDRLLSVGGFCEDLRRPGGEDPGLSFKIAAEGGRMGFVPTAIVYHHYSSKLRSVARTFWNYGYGGCYVARAYKS
jgi:GT2 family glycosyltransferase